ncbi:helix-turn-helix domain-containing protein [Nibricoccus sp. IMCC34717]|uniref:AraC family transcriptional regulator n=1 Tax=Nibricoccus sp. IMCC34717 TaxID=3034021 RepID=UPI00384B3353
MTLPSAKRSGRRVLSRTQLALEGIEELGTYHYLSARRGLRPHCESHGLEACFLARGVQHYQVGGRDYRLRGGEFYLTFPGEMHGTGGHPEERGWLFWLVVDMREEGAPLLGLEAQTARELRAELRSLPARHFSAVRGSQALWMQILTLATKPERSALDALELKALVLRLLLDLVRSARAASPVGPSLRMQRIADWMREHSAEVRTIADIASRAHLSESRFKARFTRELGIAPHEYLLRARVERARGLLGEGVSVTEAAMQCGFSSSQHFATVFRRFTRCTPSAWRRKAAQG